MKCMYCIDLKIPQPLPRCQNWVFWKTESLCRKKRVCTIMYVLFVFAIRLCLHSKFSFHFCLSTKKLRFYFDLNILDCVTTFVLKFYDHSERKSLRNFFSSVNWWGWWTKWWYLFGKLGFILWWSKENVC